MQASLRIDRPSDRIAAVAPSEDGTRPVVNARRLDPIRLVRMVKKTGG